MKKTHGIILPFVVAVLTATAAEQEYHRFTDTQGRAINAAIIRFNEAESTVTIQPENRSAMTVPIGIFSAEDQARIIEWSHIRALMDEQSLRIDVTHIEKIDRGIVKRDDDGEQKRFYHFYAVRIENRSPVDLNNLRLEYVVFYQQEKHVSGKEWEKVNQESTLHRKKPIRIPPESDTEFTTEPIIITNYQTAGTGDPATAARIDLDGQMDGIILRFVMRTGNGETHVRQITYPEDLEKPWPDKAW